MYDAGKIVAGLLVFVAVTSLPVWYNAARGTRAARPALTVGTTAKACVLPAAEMRAAHMELLDGWRTRVVRHGEHTTPAAGGGPEASQGRASSLPVRMSLTGTCLGCHAQKAEFCDKCHGYAAVSLTCFDCHVVPKGAK